MGDMVKKTEVQSVEELIGKGSIKQGKKLGEGTQTWRQQCKKQKGRDVK